MHIRVVVQEILNQKASDTFEIMLVILTGTIVGDDKTTLLYAPERKQWKMYPMCGVRDEIH